VIRREYRCIIRWCTPSCCSDTLLIFPGAAAPSLSDRSPAAQCHAMCRFAAQTICMRPSCTQGHSHNVQAQADISWPRKALMVTRVVLSLDTEQRQRQIMSRGLCSASRSEASLPHQRGFQAQFLLFICFRSLLFSAEDYSALDIERCCSCCCIVACCAGYKS